jgi:hypothetical protein
MDQRMKKRATFACSLFLTGAIFCIHKLGAKDMLMVRFDIGQNIIETAKKSGAPRWATRDLVGLVSYDLMNMPVDIPLVYQRPGYEINAMPVYSFTMYADKESNNKLAVETATVLFNTNALKSHTAAKRFAEDLILQFQKGKWTRHVEELCPAVTGRSAFLNMAGEPDRELTCPLDPGHRLSPEDWVLMMSMGGQRYEWVGDGVYAKLNVDYSDDIRGITYSIGLAFEDLATRRRRDETSRLRDLAEGDANGWNSTENEAKGIAKRKLEIKVLEENARKRGDAVLPR